MSLSLIPGPGATGFINGKYLVYLKKTQIKDY